MYVKVVNRNNYKLRNTFNKKKSNILSFKRNRKNRLKISPFPLDISTQTPPPSDTLFKTQLKTQLISIPHRDLPTLQTPQRFFLFFPREKLRKTGNILLKHEILHAF